MLGEQPKCEETRNVYIIFVEKQVGKKRDRKDQKGGGGRTNLRLIVKMEVG
jgi:hypothetical protein